MGARCRRARDIRVEICPEWDVVPALIWLRWIVYGQGRLLRGGSNRGGDRIAYSDGRASHCRAHGTSLESYLGLRIYFVRRWVAGTCNKQEDNRADSDHLSHGGR